MEFVAESWRNRPQRAVDAGRRHKGCEKRDVASGAGNNQIFVEGTFHRTRVRHAEHRTGRLDSVRDRSARLRLLGFGNTVIKVGAKTNVEVPVPLGDRILNKKGQLLD